MCGRSSSISFMALEWNETIFVLMVVFDWVFVNVWKISFVLYCYLFLGNSCVLVANTYVQIFFIPVLMRWICYVKYKQSAVQKALKDVWLWEFSKKFCRAVWPQDFVTKYKSVSFSLKTSKSSRHCKYLCSALFFFFNVILKSYHSLLSWNFCFYLSCYYSLLCWQTF